MESMTPPRDRRGRGWRWAVFALVSAASLVGWILTRLPMARAIHGHGVLWCARLHMLPIDWPCRITQSRTTAIYLVASGFVTLAVFVPTIVLARTGRRVLAFVPMLLPLAMTLAAHASSWAWTGYWASLDASTTSQPFLGPWAWSLLAEPLPGTWHPDHPIAVGVDLAVLTVPIVAMMLLFPAPRPPRIRLSARALALAFVIAGGASVVVEFAAQRLLHGGLYVDGGGWFLRSIVIVAFGLLLPLGRRRPLWTLAPVAILLSFGIPEALAGTLGGWTIFASFRAALPMALMGAAGAASMWFVARQRGLLPVGSDVAPSATPQDHLVARVHPSTIAYGLGSGMLTVAIVMSLLDPSAFQFGTTLPSYLGARQRVEDLRARMTLDEALKVGEEYRRIHGSFDGFDAAAASGGGSRLLLWDDGPVPSNLDFGPDLVVRIVTAERRSLRLVLVGGSSTYCVRSRGDGSPTYGVGSEGRPSLRADAALATCGDAPWTDDLLRPFPVDSLCDDAPEIRLCRAVQHLMREILASPTGRT